MKKTVIGLLASLFVVGCVASDGSDDADEQAAPAPSSSDVQPQAIYLKLGPIVGEPAPSPAPSAYPTPSATATSYCYACVRFP